MLLKVRCKAFILICIGIALILYSVDINKKKNLAPLYLELMRKNNNFRSTSSARHFENNARRQMERNLPHAFTFHDYQWKLTHLCTHYSTFLNNSDFSLTTYTSKAGTVKIFTHNIEHDVISSIISREGAFELNIINRILYELEKDGGLNFIDIGTNIGQHSIAAALIGRAAIAIDAALSNIQHVCASAHYLNLGHKMTLIYNVVSDIKGKSSLSYSKDGDYGSIYVDTDAISEKMNKLTFQNNATLQDSVRLNDVLGLPQIHRFKKVFLKLDVNGLEHRVLLGATEFFTRLDIHGIIMKWEWHKRRSTGDVIKSFMTERNFTPFKMNETTEMVLHMESSDFWPQHVLWRPRYLYNSFE